MTATNDFIFGPLHTALRKQLHDGLKIPGNETGFSFGDLQNHPRVRYHDPALGPVEVALLREWLDLPSTERHRSSIA